MRFVSHLLLSAFALLAVTSSTPPVQCQDNNWYGLDLYESNAAKSRLTEYRWCLAVKAGSEEKSSRPNPNRFPMCHVYASHDARQLILGPSYQSASGYAPLTAGERQALKTTADMLAQCFLPAEQRDPRMRNGGRCNALARQQWGGVKQFDEDDERRRHEQNNRDAEYRRSRQKNEAELDAAQAEADEFDDSETQADNEAEVDETGGEEIEADSAAAAADTHWNPLHRLSQRRNSKIHIKVNVE